MSNRPRRRRHRSSTDGSRGKSRGGPFRLSETLAEVMPDLALAQLFRRECRSCGFAGLRWFPGAGSAFILGVTAAAALLDSVPKEQRSATQCWQCLRCGDVGAFTSSDWEQL